MSTRLPSDFSTRMRSDLGGDFDLFEKTLQGTSPTSIRRNPYKPADLRHLNIADSVLWNEDGHYLTDRPVFTLDPLFHAGAYYVQEASSMSIVQAIRQWIEVDNQPLRILDLCAAPGGKSTALTTLGQQHLVIANEVINQRFGILKENLERWGSMNRVVTNHDVKDFKPLEGYFDIVLVDAPCSGEGLFRKDPKACAEWSQDNVNLCADRQKRILAGAQGLVKQGGLLVYCTCTYNAQENMDNVDWLVDQFDLENLSLISEAEMQIETIVRSSSHGYQFYPHRVKGEGFFLSGFRQKADHGFFYKRGKKAPKTYYQPLVQKGVEILEKHIQTDDAVQYFVDPHEHISMIDQVWWSDIQMITEVLRKNAPGSQVGSLKRDDFVPEHGLAMTTGIELQYTSIDLERSQALLYLKREPFETRVTTLGWHLIRYQGINLGWVKVLPNRINNYLPKHLRIRMEIR